MMNTHKKSQEMALSMLVAGAVVLGGWTTPGVAADLSIGAAVNTPPLSEQAPIPKEALRLRIIANSDSPDDQALKEKVRDRIIAEVALRLKGVTTAEEAKQRVQAAVPELEAIGQHILKENGSTYTLKTDVGSVPFPTKQYGNQIYPAGNYEALRMVIGKGEGQNWWCVLFPALCFVDLANGDAIQAKDMATGKPIATISIQGAEKGTVQQVQVRSWLWDFLQVVVQKVKSMIS